MDEISGYFADVKAAMDTVSPERIAEAIAILHEARQRGRKIFIMGNGGSASTATHLVCDLAKNTRVPGIPHLRVIGLADNMAAFSAYGNDDGYENVFKYQLANLVEPGDVVIGVSCSGNSPNVVNAMTLAQESGAKTIGFTGFQHGKLGPMVDVELHVTGQHIECMEDIHLMLGHLITRALRERARKQANEG
ncbi:MAG: SIS domain-containing protein [Chloroflexi bacterium]|nr:SIS domain-containing protein [Chloroflexota bacterium]MBP8055595.1 SIS domain-containing protein [Chloroflexota bacterium]